MSRLRRRPFLLTAALICLSACGSDAAEPTADPALVATPTTIAVSGDGVAPGDGYSESLDRMEEILRPSENDPDFFCRPSNLGVINRAMDVSQGPLTQINIVAEHLAGGTVDESDPATMLIESWPDEAQRAYRLTANDLGLSENSACIVLQ